MERVMVLWTFNYDLTDKELKICNIDRVTQ